MENIGKVFTKNQGIIIVGKTETGYLVKNEYDVDGKDIWEITFDVFDKTYVKKEKNETRDLLLTYAGYLANITLYNGWDGDNFKKEYFEAVNKVKVDASDKVFDFESLTKRDLEHLRFSRWDDEEKDGKVLWLLPLWLFRILPNDTVVYDFEYEKTTIGESDDDVRFGNVAYGFMLSVK